MASDVYIGIDLALMQKKPSTVSIIDGKQLYVKNISSAEEIVEIVNKFNPKCIAIDSPLQLPKEGPYRDCDIQMKKMGLKPLPITWRHMRELTRIAMRLKKKLNHFNIIETFPAGALKLKGLTKVSKNRLALLSVFFHILAKEDLKPRTKVVFNKDVIDSLICALAAKYYDKQKKNKYIEIQGKECKVVIPII